MAMTPPVEVYRTHMLEFKLRLIHCEQVASSAKSTTGLAALDYEFCFLQIRRLVELVAFSSVLRDEDRYIALRQLQQQSNPKDHGDHSRDWETAEILRRMLQISPHCLPIPFKNEAKQAGAVFNLTEKHLSYSRQADRDISNLQRFYTCKKSIQPRLAKPSGYGT